MIVKRILRRLARIRLCKPVPKTKAESEMDYWNSAKSAEGTLANEHYEQFYTTHFGLDDAYYTGKKVIDIGCGPRGTLEWADMAAERIGLDPLADSYMELGAAQHKMTYVNSGAEEIPFEDGHFDVVCSFNSLDHVDNLDAAIREIKRLVAPGGLFLLLTDVNHEPTPCEPVCYSWDIVERFAPELHLVDARHYEKIEEGLYQSILAGSPYDHSNEQRRAGVLSAKMEKRS